MRDKMDASTVFLIELGQQVHRDKTIFAAAFLALKKQIFQFADQFAQRFRGKGIQRKIQFGMRNEQSGKLRIQFGFGKKTRGFGHILRALLAAFGNPAQDAAQFSLQGQQVSWRIAPGFFRLRPCRRRQRLTVEIKGAFPVFGIIAQTIGMHIGNDFQRARLIRVHRLLQPGFSFGFVFFQEKTQGSPGHGQRIALFGFGQKRPHGVVIKRAIRACLRRKGSGKKQGKDKRQKTGNGQGGQKRFVHGVSFCMSAYFHSLRLSCGCPGFSVFCADVWP
ncbi:MAG: hypothetical protein LBB51_00875 [Zoogloeaceae bacterium]|nr:hypothetical protein [Zoogloeaceae bacterium]